MGIGEAHFYEPRGLVWATGPDAGSFLQGQFSADLSALTSGGVRYGLWLDRKGRIEGDSFLLREGEEAFLAASPACSGETLARRLEAFVIMDEVEVRLAEEPWAGAVLWGEAIGAASEALGLSLPAKGGYSNLGGAAVAFWGRRGGGPTLELLGFGAEGAESVAALERRLRDCGTTPLGAEEVAARAIEAGLPMPGREVGPGDLPQEAGLFEAGVSLDKGCYLGQEVMARLAAKGAVRRRLGRYWLEGADAPEESWGVIDGEGRRVGEWRSWARVGDRPALFAMVKRAAAEGPLALADAEGRRRAGLAPMEGGK